MVLRCPLRAPGDARGMVRRSPMSRSLCVVLSSRARAMKRPITRANGSHARARSWRSPPGAGHQRAALGAPACSWRPHSQRRLDAADRTVPAEVPVTKLLSRGSVADTLIEAVRSGPWDVVVIGHGRPAGRWSRPRDVGAFLARAASVPVLVVPNPTPRAPSSPALCGGGAGGPRGAPGARGTSPDAATRTSRPHGIMATVLPR